MGRKSIWSIMAAAMVLTAPASLAAQAMSVHQAQVADIDGMKAKFTSLGEAFPDGTMDWRPMEGVRSVKDVLMLITAECNLFPAMMGMEPATGAGATFQAEMGRLSSMSKGALLVEMGKAFDYMAAAVGGMNEAAQMKETSFFGQTVSTSAGIAMATADMHEHLGQLIAYARSNEIVPPWSRGSGM